MQDAATPTLLARRIIDNASHVIVGKTSVIELAVATLIAQGHMLVEDVPGVGKTMLAKSLATSIGCSFKRNPIYPGLVTQRCNRYFGLQPAVGRVPISGRPFNVPSSAGG